ncbi:membrane protein [Candidatus Moduliflexus flocculans]|uniref:Membrane protein n=1 Tax=Candidatus Moduliflexus flocculans TaxID=1499966 RepID=A0A0S6VPD9_9BACT|nr:membrane protein [Candidatus Moduliflexus flocculans]
MKASILILMLMFSVNSVAIAERDSISDSNRQRPMLISVLPSLAIPNAARQMLIADRVNAMHVNIRNEGVRFPLHNYRNEYIKAGVYGMNGRQRIAEAIGNSGARHYAKRAGYQPLYQGKVGQGQGFDFVYRAGRRIVVIEAKGGSSIPKVYRGALQGTPEYALSVARATLRSNTADFTARQAAKAVIRAYNAGQLDIEVVKTGHVYRKSTVTKVKTTYGKMPNSSNISTLHKISLRTGGIAALIGGGFDLLAQTRSGEGIHWKRTGSIAILSGVSGYSGTMAGTAIQRALLKNSGQLTSKLAVSRLGGLAIGNLSGGVITGAIFSYGAYFLGYSDIKTANRNMGATAGSSAIGALAWFIGAGSGGTAVVVMAAGAGIMYLFHLDDENTERERVAYLIQSIQKNLNQKSTP